MVQMVNCPDMIKSLIAMGSIDPCTAALLSLVQL